jgi:outer membrane protein assembly factor BamB
MLITTALNAKSGNVCWESKPEVLVQVAVQGSTLYSGAYARLVAYDITDGRKQWELMVPELKRGQTFVSDVLELH